MENTILTHLATILTLAVIVFIIIMIPFLIGHVLSKVFDSSLNKPMDKWFIGMVATGGLSLIICLIHISYISILYYYTNH